MKRPIEEIYYVSYIYASIFVQNPPRPPLQADPSTHLTQGVFWIWFCLTANSKIIEYRMSNKEPQNYEVFTSTFKIPCSIFCGSEKCS